MTVGKALCALVVLLLCLPAYADGPRFSIWHIDGHGYQWQQDQIDAGLPVEPSIKLIQANLRDGGAIVNGVPKLATAPTAVVPRV